MGFEGKALFGVWASGLVWVAWGFGLEDSYNTVIGVLVLGYSPEEPNLTLQ